MIVLRTFGHLKVFYSNHEIEIYNKQKTITKKIMYIEYKSDNGIVGSARIGRVKFSKSGKSVHYNGKTFQTLSGRGFKSNYFDVDTGDHYWIPGCRQDGCDALYPTTADIDDEVREEYWCEIRNLPENINISAIKVGSKY